MFFGGQTQDNKPNQYVRQQHVSQYDHFWSGYDSNASVNESLKKQQYAEDLKKQIAEKKERDRLEKEALESGQTFKTNPIKNRNNNNNNASQISSNSANVKPNYIKSESIISKPVSVGFSQTYSSPSPILNITNNFAETLRAQIDDCRRSSYSALSQPIQPLNVSQPLPTFAGSTTFDSTQFEIPNLSLSFRSNKSVNGRQSQLRSVSMNGTVSLRSTVDASSLQPPKINVQSPLDRSKVITPSIGFSTRNFKSKNSTFYQDTIPKPPSFIFSSTNPSSAVPNAQSHLSSKYQDFNVASLSHTTKPAYHQSIVKPDVPLMSETQMIYPDGYISPH